MITKFRRGAVIGTAVAAAFVGALFVVPPPASAMPMAQAAIAPAGPGCPTGTNTIVPDAAAVKKYGAQAIVPAALAHDDPQALHSPTLQKIAASNPTWVQQVQCDVTNRSNTAAMTSAHEALVAADDTAGTIPSPNWAGWMLESPLGGSGFHTVGANWTLPASTASGPTDSSLSESTWVGIGSGAYSGDTLVQAGDDVERSKIANGVVPFYELYPQENEVVVTSLPVAQNTSVSYVVNVEYDSSSKTGYFTICESGQCASLSQKLAGSTRDAQAEWIRERPSYLGTLNPLASTATETLTQSGGSVEKNGTSVGFVAGSSNAPPALLTKYEMQGCDGKTLINPGGMSSTGSFSTPVSAEGQQDPVNC